MKLFVYGCGWTGCIIRAEDVDEAAIIVQDDWSDVPLEGIKASLKELVPDGDPGIVYEWEE